MTLSSSSPVQYVPRIGPAMAKKLEHLGILTVRDLLYHTPFRYNDFSNTTHITSLHPGMTASVNGVVKQIKNIFTKTGKKIQEAVVTDDTGSISVIWFNQLYLPKIIHADDAISLSGTVGFFGNKLAIESPEYELITPDKPHLHTGRVVPIYPETAGITSKWLRSRIYFLLTEYDSLVHEYLPEVIRKEYTLPPLEEAMRTVHFPSTVKEGEFAERRLAFDEIVLMQCMSFEQKRIWEETKRAFAFSITQNIKDEFINSLPFCLTNDQTTALNAILHDLSKTIPMNRLLEGDVGSGKTVVAAAAMLAASKNGYQSILMAPTQILADQHYKTISSLLTPRGITVELIVGGTKQDISKQKKTDIIIGTHALLEQSVNFSHVGLIVIDEQQRFGVYQRALLRSKSPSDMTPHLLTMTATPIPRTLALTMYGNLSLSTLKEMPIGRLPIKTWVVAAQKRESAYTWIEKEIKAHNSQAFIICPFIEESESIISVKAATKEFEYLKTHIFTDLSVQLLHGRMKQTDKTNLLDDFRSGKTNVLVSTPVVEVGIDIPNATIMMIEGAERFGLSQLHQLRGRVGRGDKQSYCLLFTETGDEKTTNRLKILETIHNGPELAEHDMRIRGQGDLFGSRQHGIPAMVYSALADDQILNDSREVVARLTTSDPTFISFPHLRERLNESKIQNIAQD
ncbi:MAG: ATP-dependent DNA helicase RecG [Candidatus Gottesmanbacteria bacterium]